MLTYIFVYPSLQETITGQVTALRALDAHDHFLVKFHRPNAAVIKLLKVLISGSTIWGLQNTPYLLQNRNTTLGIWAIRQALFDCLESRLPRQNWS